MSHILHCEPPKEPAPGVEPIFVEIYRSEPCSDQARVQEYEIPYRQRMSIFTVLREIYEHFDATLAFRNQQCGRGICGTCRVRVDLDRLGYRNKNVKACAVPLEPGDHVVIRPALDDRVIRDVVVDF